jgi:hypothetical protein
MRKELLGFWGLQTASRFDLAKKEDNRSNQTCGSNLTESQQAEISPGGREREAGIPAQP